MRGRLGTIVVIVVSVALIAGVTAPVTALDGTSDDISAEEPIDYETDGAADDTPDNVDSVVVVQLNIQVDQQTDVNPEECQVTVQANEQTADVDLAGDTGVAVVVQENVQASSQLAIVTGTDGASAEVCQEIIQINEQSADVDADNGDHTIVVTQQSTQLGDQEVINA